MIRRGRRTVSIFMIMALTSLLSLPETLLYSLIIILSSGCCFEELQREWGRGVIMVNLLIYSTFTGAVYVNDILLTALMMDN